MSTSETSLNDEIRRAAQDVLHAAPAAASVSPDKPIARYIDHTLLKADATPVQISQLCDEAREYGFASVCVNASYVPLCAHALEGSAAIVCTVVGFPLGATTTATKVFEARDAINNGAREIDMVIEIGRLKAGDFAYVLDDITHVVAACHEHGAICKVIIETALLNDDEKAAAALLTARAGADFVKTSTGFSTAGATLADVALLRRAVGPDLGVKAAGGVRNLADAHAMIAAGATRIGASAGVAIVREARSETANAEPASHAADY